MSALVLPYTVVLYGGINYEPGDVLSALVEATDPVNAAREAERKSKRRRHDYIFACFVLEGHHEDLLPDSYHSEEE